MRNHEPYCDYRMTVRVEQLNQPGQFARLATVIGEENANLGAIDIVEARRDKKIRNITFDAQSEAHAQRVVERLKTIPNVRVVSASDRIFLMHLGGKIHTRSKVPLRTRNALSMAYTPGVARVSQAIDEDKSKVYAFTSNRLAGHCIAWHHASAFTAGAVAEPQAEGQKQRWEIKQIAWQGSKRSIPLSVFDKDDR